MKIRIAYLPEEEPKANLLLKVICGIADVEKTKKTENYPPIKHIYLITKKPKND